MTGEYRVVTLTPDERSTLERVRVDLLALSACEVPAVRAAARSALAQIAQALNGQGLDFDLYTVELPR